MTTLGQAYVQIMPSAKGISGSIQKAINPEATRAGKSAGTRIAENMSKSLGGAGKTLTKAITVPVAGAITAIGGIIGAMGFSRLTGIDTAQAKLKGLGHDAESVESIMNSALESVKGTSYGLDEAATSAAGAVAAGIPPGEELTRYLGLTGDAAAIAGSSMGEMGSIFGKVQTAQKAYTGELNQLADRGIPIFQWLAEEADVSAEAVRDMASDGEISSEMFLKAIENNIGGAAKTMGDESFMAGIANIGAAIGRLGAEFLDAGGEGEGFFSTIKPMISEMIEFIDNLSINAADLGVKFGEAFTKMIEKIREGIEWWTGLDDSTKKLILTLAGIVVAIGPVLLIVSKLITTIITIHKWFGMLKIAAGIMGGAIGAISAPVLIAIGAIAAIIAIGVALWKNWDTVKAKAKQLGQWLANTFNSAKNVVSNAMNSIRIGISNGLNAARSIVSSVTSSIRSTFSNIFNSLRSIVSGAMSGVRSAISNGMSRAFSAVTNFLGRFRDAGRRIVTSIADGIKGAIGKVTGAISNVAGKIRDFLPFSPPKIGPLTDIMDVEWGKTIGGGIEKGEDAVAKAMDDILNFDLTKKATFNDPRHNNETNPYASQQNNQPIILQVDGKTFAQIIGDYTSAEGGNRIRRIERGLA